MIPPYVLPNTGDSDGDKIEVKVDGDEAVAFYVKYHKKTKSLIFKEKTKSMKKDYTFKLILLDDNPKKALTAEYSITIKCSYCEFPLLIPKFY